MEGFFYQCRAIRETAELKEFMFRTYQGGADALMRMAWREAAEIIAKGREHEQRERFWLAYCCMYPHMTDETFIVFDDWYESLKRNAEASTKSVSTIMADVNKIIGMTMEEDDGFTVQTGRERIH